MDKRYWFCRKCKEKWNPMLNSTTRICPHCGHKVTIREDFGIEFFGQLGYKGYGVILLIIVILFIVAFQIGQNSGAFRRHADKITQDVKQALKAKPEAKGEEIDRERGKAITDKIIKTEERQQSEGLGGYKGSIF